MDADSDISSFCEVIDLWSTREAMASDIGCGGSSRIRKWWQRNNIPSEWWSRVVSTDLAKSNGVTLDVLARLAAGAAVDEARA